MYTISVIEVKVFSLLSNNSRDVFPLHTLKIMLYNIINNSQDSACILRSSTCM